MGNALMLVVKNICFLNVLSVRLDSKSINKVIVMILIVQVKLMACVRNVLQDINLINLPNYVIKLLKAVNFTIYKKLSVKHVTKVTKSHLMDFVQELKMKGVSFIVKLTSKSVLDVEISLL